MISETSKVDEFKDFLKKNSEIQSHTISFRIYWMKQYLEKEKPTKQTSLKDIENFLAILQKRINIEEWQVKQAKETIVLYIEGFLGYVLKVSVQNPKVKERKNNHWTQVESDMSQAIRVKHLSLKTEKSYLGWVRKFRRFLKEKEPNGINSADAKNFINHLALKKKVSASTQNQAFSSLLFLYRLQNKSFEGMNETHRAKETANLPVVFSKKEVGKILDCLKRQNYLLGQLLYGCGLRLMEAVTIRIKDVDLDRMKLHIHRAKGGKDRYLKIPDCLAVQLVNQITKKFSLIETIKEFNLKTKHALPTSTHEIHTFVILQSFR